MAWVAIQPTINSIDPLSLSLCARSLPLKLTRGNFSQINVATYENDRGIKKAAAARNIQLSARGDRRSPQPRPLMILHQFEADVSITPDEHAV